MNVKRFIATVLFGFAFVFAYEYLYHGVLIKPLYEQTKDLWRAEAEMQTMCAYMMGLTFLMTVVLAFIFTRNFEGKGIAEGVRFGTYVGLLLGLSMFAFYFYMPIPMALALGWLFGSFVEMVGLGIVFSLVYKK